MELLLADVIEISKADRALASLDKRSATTATPRSVTCSRSRRLRSTRRSTRPSDPRRCSVRESQELRSSERDVIEMCFRCGDEEPHTLSRGRAQARCVDGVGPSDRRACLASDRVPGADGVARGRLDLLGSYLRPGRPSTRRSSGPSNVRPGLRRRAFLARDDGRVAVRGHVAAPSTISSSASATRSPASPTRRCGRCVPRRERAQVGLGGAVDLHPRGRRRGCGPRRRRSRRPAARTSSPTGRSVTSALSSRAAPSSAGTPRRPTSPSGSGRS